MAWDADAREKAPRIPQQGALREGASSIVVPPERDAQGDPLRGDYTGIFLATLGCGAQPGHPDRSRPWAAPESITHHHDVVPDRGAHCGETFAPG